MQYNTAPINVNWKREPHFDGKNQFTFLMMEL